MINKKKYKYWLAVVAGQTVKFSSLAHMMAIAMHPGEDETWRYVAARSNLNNELKLAVADGLLKVRNPAGMGYHTFPHGDALQRAVLIPDTDLEPFLNARGIELRITPHGNGPEYWTLENAAAAMQEQLNWHDGTRAEFQDQMQEAAATGALVVLNPRTCLPCRPESVRTYWEYVTSDSVNTWLATLKAPYRWNVASPLIDVPHQSPRDFRPWEKLVPFYEPIQGVFMYQQAAREIADAEGWNDSQLIALEAEMICAINDHSLTVRDRKTGMESKHDSWEVLKLVTVEDVNLWLEKKRVPYRWTLQANTPQPQANAIDAPIDFTMLATRQQLIDAFGSFTGMDGSWFTNLKDTPKLKDARKVAGSGGKDSTEPLFCPFEVMRWLTDPKQKKGRKLTSDKGWQLLEGHFSKVYNQYSIGDTRTD